MIWADGSTTFPALGVGVVESPCGEPDQGDRVAAHHRESGQRRQRVGDAEGPSMSTAGVGRQVLREVVVQDAGSRFVIGGMTKKTATKVVIAAAVLRSNAPSATAVIPATVRYSAAPMTDAVRRGWTGWRSGGARSTGPCRPGTRDAAGEHGEEHSGGEHGQLGPEHRHRRGTAVSEERIIPVLYSPVISSTPSAPMASGR